MAYGSVYLSSITNDGVEFNVKVYSSTGSQIYNINDKIFSSGGLCLVVTDAPDTAGNSIFIKLKPTIEGPLPSLTSGWFFIIGSTTNHTLSVANSIVQLDNYMKDYLIFLNDNVKILDDIIQTINLDDIHTHTNKTVLDGTEESFTTTLKNKLDTLENYEHPVSHDPSIIAQDAANRFVTDAEKLDWNSRATGDHTHTELHEHTNKTILDATQESFTTVLKTKLDDLENYEHPVNHTPDIITQDVNNRFVTDVEKTTWNNKADSDHTHTELHEHTNKTVLDKITEDIEEGKPLWNGGEWPGSGGNIQNNPQFYTIYLTRDTGTDRLMPDAECVLPAGWEFVPGANRSSIEIKHNSNKALIFASYNSVDIPIPAPDNMFGLGYVTLYNCLSGQCSGENIPTGSGTMYEDTVYNSFRIYDLHDAKYIVTFGLAHKLPTTLA